MKTTGTSKTARTLTKSSKRKKPSVYQRLWNVLPHFDGGVVRLFARGGDFRDGDFARSAREIRRFAEAHASAGRNVYVAPNPTEHTGGTRHSSKHVTHWSYFLIDMDPLPKPTHTDDCAIGMGGECDCRVSQWEEPDPAAALYKAITWLGEWAGKDLTRRMPLIIDSGRGMQAWVRLEDILLDKSVSRKAGIVDGKIHPDTARKVNGHWLKRLDDRLKVTHGCKIDTSVSDLPRVMRCPGTPNAKTGRKAKFIHYTDTVYTGLAYLLTTIDEKYLVDPEPSVQLEKGLSVHEVWPHLTVTAQQYLSLGQSEPGRHKVLFHSLKKLHELGVTQKAALKAVKYANRQKGEDEELDISEIRRIVREVYSEEA